MSNEAKTAKVAEILNVREWNGDHGTIYFYKLLMDDDTVGTIGKKKLDAFRVGDTLTYTSEKDEYGVKFKEVKENNWKGGGGFSGQAKTFDPKSVVLSYAKDLVVAEMVNGFYANAKTAPVDDVIAYASKLYGWYNGTDTVSVNPGDTDTEFDGDKMREVPAYTGNPPAARETSAPKQYDNSKVREKPSKGGGEPSATPAQANLLAKLAGERGKNVNEMIANEWDDISDASELSKWATSYLIDVLMHMPK